MSDLKTWREQRDINQADFAKRIGTSIASVSRIETGEQWPGADLAAAIERETKGEVTVADILKTYQSRQAAE